MAILWDKLWVHWDSGEVEVTVEVMVEDIVEEALGVWWVKRQELLVLEVVMEVEGAMVADMEVVDHLEVVQNISIIIHIKDFQMKLSPLQDTLPQQRLAILATPRMEETMAIQETILHPQETTLLPREAILPLKETILLLKETILPHLSKHLLDPQTTAAAFSATARERRKLFSSGSTTSVSAASCAGASTT